METNNEMASIVGLAFALACEHLAKQTGKSPSYWSELFGNQAIKLIHDDSIAPQEIERLSMNAFNRGQKI